jgi:DNA-3-methyladenine glycosylase I
MAERCEWANSSSDQTAYHDTEWGVPLHDDRLLFEFLVLEGAQAGLSWETVLRKRGTYRDAFDGFDIATVAGYDGAKVESLLRYPGIVRNRLKVESAVTNARAVLEIQAEFGSFDAYLWGFVNGVPSKGRARVDGGHSRDDRGLGDHESRPQEARVQVRGADDLLRPHAGDRHGQ